jgi:FdrA protein
MAAGYVIRKNQYYDSVFLMRVARTLSEEAGVQQCAVLMATDANKELLAEIGFNSTEVMAATPNDLVIAILADNAGLIDRLLGEMDTRLKSVSRPEKSTTFRSIEDANAAYPQSNLVVISTPGEYAAREARKALEQGKHVFLFSNHVPLDQEVELKQYAKSRRLLMMGPDCGTGLINGVGIGFANRVRRGPVGVVGASGTGIQEFTSLVHQAGSGIAHALGTGSHDLSDAVGGITTQMGLEILENDPSTRVIALISKPSGVRTLSALQEWIKDCRKPVVGCLLGLNRPLDCGPNFYQVGAIDEAVKQALICLGMSGSARFLEHEPIDANTIENEIKSWLPEQRYLRGIFAEGKPHPMIDARESYSRILKEADDPEAGILLLDFILGEISSIDPVGDLLEAIRQAKSKAARRGGRLTVVASICGTDQDPQNLESQRSRLLETGVFLLPSSAQAARLCLELLRKAGGRRDE